MPARAASNVPAQFDHLVRSIKAVDAHAAGVRLNVENHKGTMALCGQLTRDIVDAVGSDNVGIITIRNLWRMGLMNLAAEYDVQRGRSGTSISRTRWRTTTAASRRCRPVRAWCHGPMRSPRWSPMATTGHHRRLHEALCRSTRSRNQSAQRTQVHPRLHRAREEAGPVMKIAIVGCGGIGQRYSILKDFAEVIAVCDRTRYGPPKQRRNPGRGPMPRSRRHSPQKPLMWCSSPRRPAFISRCSCPLWRRASMSFSKSLWPRR